jgi:hypothetical protein
LCDRSDLLPVQGERRVLSPASVLKARVGKPVDSYTVLAFFSA